MADLTQQSLPPPGVICSIEDYQQSQAEASNQAHTIHCLSRKESIGLTLPVETGFLSLLAVTIVALLILRNIRRYKRRYPKNKWRLFQEPTDIFMVSLFIFDAIQALGAVLDLHWILAGKVFIGSVCSAQGAIQQIGETGVAMVTLAIAVHTFTTVWWKREEMHWWTLWVHSTKAAWIIIGTIWLYVGLFTGIGIGIHSKKNTLYISPTPYWCWISREHLLLRIFGEYLWLYLTLVFSFMAYVPLFFWARGNIIPGGNHWYSYKWQKSALKANTPEAKLARRQAMDLLAYPISYSIIVLPLTLTRWIAFGREAQHKDVPSAATIAVVTIFGLSGIVNAVLFLTTRPGRLLFSREAPAEEADGLPMPRLTVTVHPPPEGGEEIEEVKIPHGHNRQSTSSYNASDYGGWNPNPGPEGNDSGEEKA